MSSILMKKYHIVAFIFLLFIFLLNIKIWSFSRPNTICSGREFNKRVKILLDGGDVAVDNIAISFSRGNNPPAEESDFYIDVSEDNDKSVIVYFTYVDVKDDGNNLVNLYWYSNDNVFMNENTAYMFQGFVALRHIDLTGFNYFNGLNDLRYMFKDCRHLRDVRLNVKGSGLNPSAGSYFTPIEMQGMFYSCQSMQSIDLTSFNTYLVSNMDELFCKCLNLKNIYVDKTGWNTQAVTRCNRMFTDCYLLKTIQGKKAVDIDDDDFENYISLSLNGKDSFIRDINADYSNYSTSNTLSDDVYSVPIEDNNYIMEIPETIEEYSEEPEDDFGLSSGNSDNSINQNDNNAFQMLSADTTQNIEQNTNQNLESIIQNNLSINDNIVANENVISNEQAVQETSIINENIVEENVSVNNINNNINNNIDNNSDSKNEIVEDNLNTVNIEDTTNMKNNDISNNNEITNQQNNIRMIEINEFLNGEKSNNNQAVNNLFNEYQPLLILFLAIAFIGLLLFGMIMYLVKEKSKH